MAISLMLPLVGKTQIDLQRVDKGTGSLSFTRTTTATRLNPATDKIEVVASGDLREDGRAYKNLATFSEQFGSWGRYNATVESNCMIAPDGKLTADKITGTTEGNWVYNYLYPRIGSVLVSSIFVKRGSGDRFYIWITNGSNSYFDYSFVTGIATLSGSAPFLAHGAIQYSDGWVRLWVATLTSGPTYQFSMDPSPTVAGKYAYIWGAQIEEGISPGRYVKTGADPAYAPKGVLIEGQRTNLLLNSGNLYLWGDHNTPTSFQNYGVAPDGTQTSTLIVDDMAGDFEGKYQSPSITVDMARKTFSVFVKAATLSHALIYFNPGFAHGVVFDLETGVGTFYTGVIDTDRWSSKYFGNGWWRLIISALNVSGSTCACYVFAGQNVGEQGSVEAWGGQLEEADFASSYIPTTSAAVTRNQDDVKLQRDGNFDNAVGSAYAEFDTLEGSAGAIIASDNGSVANTVMYQWSGYGLVGYDGTTVFLGPPMFALMRNRAVTSWGGGVYKGCVNGRPIVSDARFSGNMGLTSNLVFGAYGSAGTLGRAFCHLKNLILFDRVLTDTEMIALTTTQQWLVIKADPVSPAAQGTSITFTAFPDDLAEYEYEYRAKFTGAPDDTFGVVRGFVADPKWTWDSTGAPQVSYDFKVSVRLRGTSGPTIMSAFMSYVIV